MGKYKVINLGHTVRRSVELMPHPALIKQRPWLIAALVAAIAYNFLQSTILPQSYLILLEFLPFALLTNYVLARHRGADSNLLALMLLLEGVGAAFYDVFDYQGTAFTMVGSVVGIGLFLHHIENDLSSPSKWVPAIILFLAPTVLSFASGISRGVSPAFQGLALGGMAATAWMSAFRRDRVGAGAIAIMTATLIALQSPGHWLSWPLFFIGYLVLTTGVIRGLLEQEQMSQLTQER